MTALAGLLPTTPVFTACARALCRIVCILITVWIPTFLFIRSSQRSWIMFGFSFLIRLDPNGVLDASFGNNGIALYDAGNREQCYDLIVQCDDTILITGHSGISNAGVSDWALVVLKYDPNGILDPTFGNQGIYSYNPTENVEWGYGLALQPDGKIIVSGEANNGVDDNVILLRLENSLCQSNDPNESNYTDEGELPIDSEP